MCRDSKSCQFILTFHSFNSSFYSRSRLLQLTRYINYLGLLTYWPGLSSIESSRQSPNRQSIEPVLLMLANINGLLSRYWQNFIKAFDLVHLLTDPRKSSGNDFGKLLIRCGCRLTYFILRWHLYCSCLYHTVCSGTTCRYLMGRCSHAWPKERPWLLASVE